jgi:hypothetical protein
MKRLLMALALAGLAVNQAQALDKVTLSSDWA